MTLPSSTYSYPPALMKQQEAAYYAGGESSLEVLQLFFELKRCSWSKKHVRYFKADIDEAMNLARLKGWPTREQYEAKKKRLRAPSAC